MSASFNPQAWLEAFEAVGGWYLVGTDHRVSIGWMLGDTGDGEKARLLFKEIQHNDQRAAMLKEHVLARQRIPA